MLLTKEELRSMAFPGQAADETPAPQRTQQSGPQIPEPQRLGHGTGDGLQHGVCGNTAGQRQVTCSWAVITLCFSGITPSQDP